MQCDAIDQLHRIVLQAVVFPDPKDGDDMGMVQARGGFRFSSKPLPMARFLG
jgi:hypothetical protein